MVWCLYLFVNPNEKKQMLKYKQEYVGHDCKMIINWQKSQKKFQFTYGKLMFLVLFTLVPGSSLFTTCE